jgi:hypothetical protein
MRTDIWPQYALLLVLSTSAGVVAQTFQPACTLPEQIALANQKRRIDKLCPAATGDAPGDQAAHREQNTRKNDFCKTGTPLDINRDTFL